MGDRLKYSVNVPHFGGVFMCDDLPQKPWKNECAVMTKAPEKVRTKLLFGRKDVTWFISTRAH